MFFPNFTYNVYRAVNLRYLWDQTSSFQTDASGIYSWKSSAVVFSQPLIIIVKTPNNEIVWH